MAFCDIYAYAYDSYVETALDISENHSLRYLTMPRIYWSASVEQTWIFRWLENIASPSLRQIDLTFVEGHDPVLRATPISFNWEALDFELTSGRIANLERVRVLGRPGEIANSVRLPRLEAKGLLETVAVRFL